jgi:hypothetical protein
VQDPVCSRTGQWALAVRQAVRHSIMNGDIKGAVEHIRAAGFTQVKILSPTLNESSCIMN